MDDKKKIQSEKPLTWGEFKTELDNWGIQDDMVILEINVTRMFSERLYVKIYKDNSFRVFGFSIDDRHPRGIKYPIEES